MHSTQEGCELMVKARRQDNRHVLRVVPCPCGLSPGGALRVKISRGAQLQVQNGTQQDLNEIIDLVNFGGKKIVYMLKMGGFEMGPNKIWIKW